MKKKFLFSVLVSALLVIPNAMAHCPLCTIGAGAAAAGAVWLGVSKIVIALFVGAFAMSMGMWFSKIPKKKYFPFQKTIITAFIFLTTIIPLLPIFTTIGPLYIPFLGDYGATFAVDYSLGSGLLGALVVFSAPYLSNFITKARDGKMLPFQGVSLTILMLLISGFIIQMVG